MIELKTIRNDIGTLVARTNESEIAECYWYLEEKEEWKEIAESCLDVLGDLAKVISDNKVEKYVYDNLDLKRIIKT